MHINFPWGNLSPLPPCLLPCSSLLSSQRLIHSTWRYFAGGGTNLVYDKSVVTASSCYTSRFRFTALSSSSFLILLILLLLLFSSASLAGFHLECTSNSLGATSLWPAGLPKALKYTWLLASEPRSVSSSKMLRSMSICAIMWRCNTSASFTSEPKTKLSTSLEAGKN